jgi:hypothetical protein
LRSTTIGRTRHKVQVFEPGEPVPDGEGGFTEGVVPLTPPEWYCSIEAATAFNVEREVANTVTATASHILRGRFHPGITTKTTITFTDGHRGGLVRTFAVDSVRSLDERGESLVLSAREIVDADTAGGTAASAPAIAPPTW